MPASRASVHRGRRTNSKQSVPRTLEKCPTGVTGFDEITEGGLPRGRPTLICGGPGCGKSIFALEFLLRGALQYGEPGVFVSFEETPEDIRKNVASLGFDVAALIDKKLLVVDHVRVERSEIEETGEYDLEGLFIRLGYAIDSIGARRVVLDTIESLFSALTNTAVVRAELRRLFGWLKEKGVTAIITGERGEGSLTRQGLEEYVSDCVVLLDHRVNSGISTRRLRVVKYRGSTHGTNEYPFLIDQAGVSVTPITSLGLTHEAPNERVSTGIPRLDNMLQGGYHRGSSILVSGTAGSGKSSLAAKFVEATCERGERCLYFAFEESPKQIVRNMRSIGIDFERPMRRGTLEIHSARPSLHGLETHLALMLRSVNERKASAVVLDPITVFLQSGGVEDVHGMLVRMVDFLKMNQIIAFFTSLTGGGRVAESTEVAISSLMDTWLLLRNLESSGERNRGLYVLKSRGTAHSNQIREFILTSQGVDLVDVYTGADGVLTGSARIAQEARESVAEAQRRAELADRERQFEQRRAALRAQIVGLEAEIEREAVAIENARNEQRTRDQMTVALRRQLATRRSADTASDDSAKRPRKRNGGNEARS
jgi:circadian clock protein KaiC